MTAIKKTAAVLLTMLCFCSTNVEASDRNFVMSKINSEYYSDSFVDTIEKLQTIDITLDDDTYLKQIFKCLDNNSMYYTKKEYEAQVITENSRMISASFLNDTVEVKIDHFGKGIEENFKYYMEKCKKEEISTLILDLTECPGGYVSVMSEIANYIMPKGIIMTAKFRNDEKVYYSNLEKCPFEKIIVKVSSHTASAAEILAAGLQEAGVSTVVGVNTYGKTSIQSIYRLENGGAFKLTCGKYLTRNGNDISVTGLSPDIIDYSYPVKIRWNKNCMSKFEKAVSK